MTKINDPSAVGARTRESTFTMNAHGIVVEWTSDAAAIFGWSESDALGRSLSELIIRPEDRDSHEEGLRRFIGGAAGKFIGKPLELNVIDRDGNQIVVAFLISIDKSERGVRFPTVARRVTP